MSGALRSLAIILADPTTSHDVQSDFYPNWPLLQWVNHKVNDYGLNGRTLLRRFARRVGIPTHITQDQSAFFSRLPPEIRREILLHAFGNRNLRMFYYLKLPIRGRVDNDEAYRNHDQGSLIFNTQAVMSRSSVYYRKPPWLVYLYLSWLRRWSRPDHNRCMDDYDRWAFDARWRERSDYYRAGAMGWLLSCSKAYDEGIELLYMTNTFQMLGSVDKVYYTRHISSTRLAQISSFEFVLPLAVSSDTASLRPSDMILPMILQDLVRYTNVKRLHLSLEYPCFHITFVDFDMTHILNPMDDFVRTSRAEFVVLQLHDSAITRLAADASPLDEDSVEVTETKSSYQLWRSLDNNGNEEDDASTTKVQKRQCSRVSANTSFYRSASSEFGHGLGYWIVPPIEEPDVLSKILASRQ